MARRYDSRTTIFSPEGRLYQVEYAMEAISNAGAALGVLASDGVVLAAEKRITSKVIRGGSLLFSALVFLSAHCREVESGREAVIEQEKRSDSRRETEKEKRMEAIDQHRSSLCSPNSLSLSSNHNSSSTPTRSASGGRRCTSSTGT